MVTLIFSVIVIIVLDSLVSASEAAIFSVSVNRAKFLAEKSKMAKVLLSLKERMERPLTTLIALSNLITIAGSTLTGVLVFKTLGEEWVGIFAAGLTFLIMVVAEIIPKRLGERYAEPVALAGAVPLFVVSKIFTPITWFIGMVTAPFIRRRKRGSLSEDYIAFLARQGALEGIIEKYEGELIQKIFKLNDITAARIMTPKSSVFFLDGRKTVGELESEIYRSIHSRMPVYSGDVNRVVGMAHQRDLLRALARGKRDTLISQLARPALVVSEDREGDELLRDFQKTQKHLAVVVNDKKEVVGVVGLEDVLEELVGEIIDEKENFQTIEKKLNHS